MNDFLPGLPDQRGTEPPPKFSHPGLTHRDGTQCIFVDGGWFVPLDAGGEGYDCTNAEHREISNPRRGDRVEAWLKTRRDEFDKTSTYGGAIHLILDGILDDYRLAADLGLSLEELEKYDGPR